MPYSTVGFIDASLALFLGKRQILRGCTTNVLPKSAWLQRLMDISRSVRLEAADADVAEVKNMRVIPLMNIPLRVPPS